jgi:hypothetical protein
MKAQYAQEISAAHLQIQDFQKTVEDTLRRAEEAEAYQKTVQTELAEAKVVQKYNAQLHKDLQREQLARKKLHNDMEDMKGACLHCLLSLVAFCGGSGFLMPVSACL